MEYWLNGASLEVELSYLLDVVYDKTSFNFSKSVTLTQRYIQLRKDGASIEEAVASL